MFGNIHCAVRWKTVSCATSSAIVGAIWKPLAPGADEREARAADVDARVPTRGVERRPGEVVHAGDVGEVRLVE